MTKSIIFCAVFPILLDLFFESPNFFSEPFWIISEPFSELSCVSPNFSTELPSFSRYFSRVLFAMIEAGAKEVSNDVMFNGIMAGHEANQQIIEFIKEIQREVGREKSRSSAGALR